MRSSRRGSSAPGQLTLEDAKAVVLRVLAFHARTEAQVRDRLARAGAGEHADAVVAWLRRLGYLDDAAYARGRARTLLARVGPRVAEQRLRAAGIAAEVARHVVMAETEERARERLPGESAELALCRAALRAKLRGADPAALDERGRARLARFLVGRGFSAAAVSRAL